MPKKSLQPLLGAGLSLLFVILWFATLGPKDLGGPITYAVVKGVSMEPNLTTDDLVLARGVNEGSYNVGDIVVFDLYVRNADRTYSVEKIIHRLVSVSSTDKWLTKGDNKPELDPWEISEERILGKVEYVLPKIGGIIFWVRDNPFVAGSFWLILTLLLFIPKRRLRIHPALAGTLLKSAREFDSGKRTLSEKFALISGLLATTFLLTLIYILYGTGSIFEPVGNLVVGLAAVVLVFLVLIVLRLFDGKWIPEPKSSMYALSGRTYLVDKFPPMAEIQEVDSAIALRDIAEKYRLPILHRINKKTGFHEYMLITVQRGTYLYVAREKRIRGGFNRSMNKTLA